VIGPSPASSLGRGVVPLDRGDVDRFGICGTFLGILIAGFL